VLKIVTWVDGEILLVYNCPLFRKYGHACRHMYKLLGRQPKLTDAKVRWHIGYAHDYGTMSVLSDHYRDMRVAHSNYPGIPLTPDDVKAIKLCMRVGEGEKPLENFTCSVNKLRWRGKKNYWTLVAHHFSEAVQQCIQCNGTSNSADDAFESNCSGTVFLLLDVECDSGVKNNAKCEAGSGPFAANEQISCLSTYMVPSQTQTQTLVQDL